MPEKANALVAPQLRSYEAKRDLAAELLKSVQQMKAGKTQIVPYSAAKARKHTAEDVAAD